jgi:hypothetical protein
MAAASHAFLHRAKELRHEHLRSHREHQPVRFDENESFFVLFLFPSHARSGHQLLFLKG